MLDNILSIQNITKRFPGVVALDGVSFEVQRGKIHALVGENGAGKSTLIKILSGVYPLESGSFEFDGQAAGFSQPLDAIRAGISVVHQEIRLVEQLRVAENIFIGRPPMRGGLVDRRTLNRNARALLDSIGADIIDEREYVGNLSIAQQQMVEICKALSYNTKLIIMDEPSASLTDKELTMLFNILRKLREDGITVIYISHRLEEIFEISDNVTVLRDGAAIHTGPVAGMDRPALISMMVGRELEQEYPKENVPHGDVLLEVRNLTRPGVIEDISFQLRRGELLGVAGLVGSGRTEMARTIFGADGGRSVHGEILVGGRPVRVRNVRDAKKQNIALIPEDRKRQGLVLEMSVRENVSMANIGRVIRGGFIRRRRENALAREYIQALRIATPGEQQAVKNLSGGNQQKVVLAKWLAADSDILILDEPTRGVDVGAKAEIYKLLTSFVRQDKGVIMISSDMPELLGMCDRILVFRDGRISGELQRVEATQERILDLAIK